MDPIMAIKINGRKAKAPKVQDILTQYGGIIRTRVGFHETEDKDCAMDGILILQLSGEESEAKKMYEDLEKLDGVLVKFIDF